MSERSERADGTSSTDRAGADGGRRQPVPALVLLALAAIGMWAASRATWVRFESADGLGAPQTRTIDGGTWFGALTPLALVSVASIAALLAVRGWFVRVLGAVLAVIGMVVAVPSIALLSGTAATAQRAAQLTDLPGRAQVTAVSTQPLPAVVAVLAAVCAFVAGLLLVRRPRAGGGLSAKYTTPTVRRAEATRRAGESQTPERVLWDALDAGTDPTDPGAEAGSDPDPGPDTAGRP